MKFLINIPWCLCKARIAIYGTTFISDYKIVDKIGIKIIETLTFAKIHVFFTNSI